MTDLSSRLLKLTSWYKNDVIPLWVATAYDQENGGFFEALDFQGKPLTDLERRVRVQSRQIHTFTHFALLGWAKEADTIAAKGFDDLIRFACPDKGESGCAHRLSSSNAVVNEKRDLYDQAFLLLACAARIKGGDANALTIAENTTSFLNRTMRSDAGGWIEDDSNTLPRRANPHMHLLEAFTGLYRATGEDRWLGYAEEIVGIFLKKFYDRDHGVLREFFDQDLNLAEGDLGAIIEPGHMMEWAWLLRDYTLQAKAAPLDEATTLIEKSIELGTDGNSPFLLNTRSTNNIIKTGAKRLWPQTEYLRTLLGYVDDNPVYAKKARELIDAMVEYYFDVEMPGLWCDVLDEKNQQTAKNVPASILYHLYETVRVAEDYLESRK